MTLGPMSSAPLLSKILLLAPTRIQTALEAAEDKGLVAEAPNLWQITLGVMRMVHRMISRPDSIGLSVDSAPRRGLRARLLRARPLRLPFVLAVGAVRPWDLSGMLSRPDEVIRHLVGTHHDRHQFAYDLQILSLTEGALERLLGEAIRTRDGDSAMGRLMQDLCVFEGYHERLVHAVERALERDFQLDPSEAEDPDISFEAYLRWCKRQPATPAETLLAIREGRFAIGRAEPFGTLPAGG